jgi:hypothetical protein
MHARMYVYMYVLCVCVCVCVYVCLYARMHLCMMEVHMYACMYVYMYVGYVKLQLGGCFKLEDGNYWAAGTRQVKFAMEIYLKHTNTVAVRIFEVMCDGFYT